MRYRYILILFVLFLSSCEERVDWDLESENITILVVDGMITNEQKHQRVILTKPVMGLNEKPEPVSGALVAISDGDVVYILTEDNRNPGVYLTDSTVRGEIGKAYYLYIKIGNEEFTGHDYMTAVEPLKPFLYHKVQGYENLYEMYYNESRDPSMMHVYFNWSYLVDPAERATAMAFVHYYSLKSIDVNELFKPDQERVFFPAGTVVLRKKYSLSYAHQVFIRSMMMETEWKGGVFDVMPANVISNITGRAVGFFSASAIVSDTIIVQSIQ